MSPSNRFLARNCVNVSIVFAGPVQLNAGLTCKSVLQVDAYLVKFDYIFFYI